MSERTWSDCIKERDALRRQLAEATATCAQWEATVREQGGHVADCILHPNGATECAPGCEAYEAAPAEE